MFAITGITGQVGAAVARSLLSAGQTVRAVVRDRAKGAPWEKMGCDIGGSRRIGHCGAGGRFRGCVRRLRAPSSGSSIQASGLSRSYQSY